MSLKSLLIVLLLTSAAFAQSPDSFLESGRKAAAEKNWTSAEQALEQGFRAYPRDARFPAELAALAFVRKQHDAARHWVRRALSLAPLDEYSNQLAGTLYLQEGNLEAALKFWNRAGWPRIERLIIDPPVNTDPVLLDRAITAAPASVLMREDYLRSERQLRHLNLLASSNLELASAAGDDLNLRLRAREHASWSNNRKLAALRLFRGLPVLTIYPEFYNIGRSSTSLVSRLRFDPRWARVNADLTRPMKNNPSWVLGFSIDGRDEEWDLRNPQTLAQLSRFTMRTLRVGPTLSKVLSPTCEWSTALEFTRTTFNGGARPSFTGSGAANRHEIGCDLVRLPERRLTIRGDSRVTIARYWDDARSRFAQVQPSINLQWFPQPTGDDYRTQLAFSAGATAGDVPLNHQFVLGNDRDDGVPLRGHHALTNRRKGRAPLAPNFVLANAEADKTLYRRGFIQVAAGPWVDAARVWKSPNAGNTWFIDAGLQLKVRVFGEFGVALSYGWDLRQGRDALGARTTTN